MRIGDAAARGRSTSRTMSEFAPSCQRHEVDEVDGAVRGLEAGLEDQRAVPVALRGRRGAAVGRADQPAPVLGPPSSAAKVLSESKRGQHSQSIEPSRPTSAALWQSPIRP